MVDLSADKKHKELIEFLDDYTPEMKLADDNIDFENKVLEKPVLPGIGQVDVFGECWDINSILKGNYWGRTIYTTDKICKLFLKWNLDRQKKYLAKKKQLDFNYTWLIILMIAGVGALIFIMFVLPRLGAI